ncbi:MAG: tRNA threonylcarbamoyladenosine dehydratase [Eubacteriales bacterium]|nr:tRNA threonylcarbamoyladenosine dehydratase [Eubacteriales bacterium]
MTNDIFSRTELLLGPAALERLSRCKVAIFGIGGVGSFVAEALARSGVGAFVLVDSDVVAASNINRQILALHSTVGQPKVEVMRDRILDINPQAKVETLQQFLLPDNTAQMLQPDWDYIVDAIDTVSAKIELAVQATTRGIPIISSMGAGNKLDPTRFEVTDLYQTSVCPLSKVMRRELRKRGIDHLKVVYSPEEPLRPSVNESAADETVAAPDLEPVLDDTLPRAPYKRRIPGSVAFVPSVVGLIIAGEVVKDLIQVVR